MKIKIIENPAKFMHESGLLFELNRKVLHPLGLALYYGENDKGEIEIQGLGVQDFGEVIEGYESDRAEAAQNRLDAFLVWRRAELASRQESGGDT